MAQKPLSEMADTGYDNMSEEVGYALHEFKLHANAILAKLESQYPTLEELRNLYDRLEGFTKAADFSEFQQHVEQVLAGNASSETLWQSSEVAFASKSETTKELQSLSARLENLASLRDDVRSLENMFERHPTREEYNEQINFITNLLDILKCQHIIVEIDPADVKTLNATPVQVVSPFGAGKMIEIVRFELLKVEGTAYVTDATKKLSLEYSTSGQLIEVPTEGFLDSASKERRCQHHPDTHPVGEDEAIMLTMTAGEVTVGDSPLKLRLDFKVVDVLT